MKSTNVQAIVIFTILALVQKFNYSNGQTTDANKSFNPLENLILNNGNKTDSESLSENYSENHIRVKRQYGYTPYPPIIFGGIGGFGGVGLGGLGFGGRGFGGRGFGGRGFGGRGIGGRGIGGRGGFGGRGGGGGRG